MNETQIANQMNSLSWLIPTGVNDIAVRDILVPIFGDAVACKVPGAPCGDPAYANTSKLIEAIFSTYGAGTLAFAMILLIFIGLMGLVKTASDGEFFGRSWNTTFTALRLVAAIAFIIPNGNGMSTIQNFTLYVGLWSSGFANYTNVAISSHYLERLQRNIIRSEPNGDTTRSDAPNILKMHICAAYIAKAYPESQLAMENARSFRETNPNGTSVDPIGNLTGPSTGPIDTMEEYAYVERGTYLTPGSAPCGRLVINPSKVADARLSSVVPTDGVYNAALGASPLTADARAKIASSMSGVGSNARAAKIAAIKALVSDTGEMRVLANEIVNGYQQAQIKYDPSTAAVKEATASDAARLVWGSKEYGVNIITRYANIIAASDLALSNRINTYRQSLVEANGDTGGDFFKAASDMLTQGGWMSTAATYRTMLDMSSIHFQAESQSPYTFNSRSSNESIGSAPAPDGMAQQLAVVDTFLDKLMASDSAKQIVNIAQANSSTSSAQLAPPMNMSVLKNIVENKVDLNSTITALYGNGWLDNMRRRLMVSASISSDYDPLYQIKNIGDSAALASESIFFSEMLFRSVHSFYMGFAALDPTQTATRLGNAVAGIFELPTIIMRALATMLATMGFAFSTWLPAIPYVAFLLSQLGWIFGLVMTLFAINIWGVMHLTPAKQDSFIGSEVQGYLLLLSLFFRPVIATSALSLSHLIAPPVIKLINITLIPMVYASNVSSNTISMFLVTAFGLVLYFIVVKGAITAIYMLPQSFPDDVMRIISAGIGDLGQSKAMSTMEAGAGAGRMAEESLNGINKASSENYKGKLKNLRDAKEKKLADALAKDNQEELLNKINSTGSSVNGAGSGLKS